MTTTIKAKTTTKANLTTAVHELELNFTKKRSAELVDIVFDTIKGELEGGNKIKISGFGNFEVRDKKERPGRNPQTRQELTISARRILRFKPSQKLKEQLNVNRPKSIVVD